jgi:preprotein translocase subunit SecD
MRRRPVWSLVFLVGLAALALTWTLVAGNKPFLGLDLQGGVSVVLTPKGETDTDTLEQAKAIIDQRVNALGIAEPEITTQGNNLIVQIPGVKDKDRALELVGQTAELQFRPVLDYQPAGVPITTPDTSTDSSMPTDSSVPTDSSSTPSSDSSPDATVESTPPSSEQGLGVTGEGEFAAGLQTSDTVTDSTASTDSSTPSTDSTVPAVDPSTLSAAAQQQALTLPPDVCVTGVPSADNQPDQTVVLPECDRETSTSSVRWC